MRMFSLVAILLCLVIIGWFTAVYLESATRGLKGREGGSAAGQNPVEAARGLASMDMERTKMMEEMLP